jgi:hypothetical protein
MHNKQVYISKMVHLNDLGILQLQIKISWSYKYLAPTNLSFLEPELLACETQKLFIRQLEGMQIICSHSFPNILNVAHQVRWLLVTKFPIQ